MTKHAGDSEKWRRGMRSVNTKRRNDVRTTVGNLLQDRKRLERLLASEKQRRGRPTDALVFVGTRNVALHWWCTQQAILRSRADETKFFAAFLQDRIEYAHRLGLVEELPRLDEEVLDVGREITLSAAEGLHESDQKTLSSGNGPTQVASDVVVAHIERVDKDGNRTRFINPDLPPDEKNMFEKEAEAHGIRLISDPIVRGNFLHATRAEKYPSFRWNFTWGKYTVVGVADGLTKEFVYEFKTTQKRFYLQSQKPIALAQADLYGYFFQRPRKRVQIHIMEEGQTETYDEPVNIARAEETLTAFARVDQGEPALLPKPWKCRICEFRSSCAIAKRGDGSAQVVLNSVD